MAALAIRGASIAVPLILIAFNILRLSIRERRYSWRAILRHSRFWLITGFAIVCLCLTKFFLSGAVILPQSDHGPASRPIYGPGFYGFYIHAAYFGLGILALIFLYIRDVRRATGSERMELAFILIGATCAVGFSILTATVLRFFIEPAQLLWFAPLRVVLFSLVVAYGIATRKIMEVGLFLRRIISYGLLAAYLLTLYALVWWLAVTALQSLLLSNAQSVAHVAAAIAVAFAMAPARGLSQRLAERLFISARGLDFQATVSKAAKILNSVTTLRDLLDKFAHTVAEAVGTDRVFILLPSKQGFSQQYPIVQPGARLGRLELDLEQATIKQLAASREPIVLDELHRARPTPQLERVVRQLDSLQIALAIGIFSRDHLAGVMLLGPRISGRIYGSVEQNALQVLCGQLAVAIENARLFTEVQNAKIYNETLLENLTTGVIARKAPAACRDARCHEPAAPVTAGKIEYEDRNYAERAGWKEIVIAAQGKAAIRNASQGDRDRSQALTAYPQDPTVAPPQDLRASLDWSVASREVAAAVPHSPAHKQSPRTVSPVPPEPAASGTVVRGDYLSKLLSHREIGWGMALAGLAVAFGLGAVHALSPGHGKTIVAAYLVGTRGTAKHALFLGAMVTFTHTISVFFLGFVTLFLSQYVLPEKIFPVLGAISGLSIVWIGATLLYKRARGLREHSHEHEHDHAATITPTTIITARAGILTFPKATSPSAASSHWARAAGWCPARRRWCCC